MILFHWTRATNLPGIAEHGLHPVSNDDQTFCRDLSWLTTAPTMMPTAADRRWLRAKHGRGIFTDYERKRFLELGFLGAPDLQRLTVRVRRNKRLVHYASWLKEPKMVIDEDGQCLTHSEHWLSFLAPSARAHWWVSFKPIPACDITEGLPAPAQEAA